MRRWDARGRRRPATAGTRDGNAPAATRSSGDGSVVGDGHVGPAVTGRGARRGAGSQLVVRRGQSAQPADIRTGRVRFGVRLMASESPSGQDTHRPAHRRPIRRGRSCPAT
ncbi:hypothetical protein GCM10010254_54420 [Streptomyces chromofuscus]|nr:hypothetical protein GCM10010254_54420 [Streptomyces chromofuscus]